MSPNKSFKVTSLGELTQLPIQQFLLFLQPEHQYHLLNRVRSEYPRVVLRRTEAFPHGRPPAFSLIAQRDQRIDRGRTPRGEVTGQQRHTGQHRRDSYKGRRISGRHAEQQSANQAR